MVRYRHRPIVVEAMKWTGSNIQEITNFMAGFEATIEAAAEEPAYRNIVPVCLGRFDFTTAPASLVIPTAGGDLRANAGDWVILGANGEIYPCKADVFTATYEEVTDGDAESPR